MAGGIDGDDFLARMEAQRREMMQKNDILTADALHFPGEVQVGAPPAGDGVPGPHRSNKSAQQPASHQESLSSGKRADYSQRFRDLIGSIHDHVGGDEDEGATDAPYFDFELGGWTTSTTTAPASSGDEAGAGLSSASTVSAPTAKNAARVAASASSFRATGGGGGVPKPTKHPSADRLTRPPLAPQRPPLPKLVAEQAKEVIPAHRRFSPRTARTLAGNRSASSTASSSRPDFDVGVGAAASKPEHDMDDCGLTAQDRMDLQEIRDIASGKQQLPPPAFYAIDKATPNYRTPLTLDQAVQSMAAASSDSDSNRLQLDRNGGFDFERVVNSRRAGFTTLTPAEEAVLFDCLPRSCFSGQRVGGRALAADENVKQVRLEKVQKSERGVTVTTHASAVTGTRAVPEDHDASASSAFATPSAETSRSGSKSSCSTGVSSSAPGSAMTTSSSSRCAKNSAKDEFLARLRSLRRAEKGNGSVILNLRVLARAFRKVIQNPECAKYRRLDAAKLRRAVFGSRTEVTSQAHSTVTADHFQYDLLDCLLECVGWRFLPAVADNHTDKKAGIKSVGDAVENEKLPSGDRFVFPLRKRGTDAGDDTYTKLSTLRMAVQFLEVLLDGHHDPSTLFPTESSGGTAINENGFATATLRGLCGAVENRLRAVLGEAAEKIQLSDIGSRLAASGLGVNVRHAVRMWVQGSWPSFAITLAAGEDCGLRGSTASEGNNGAPSSELEKLLSETESALATATSKSKKMMDKSSHNSSSSSSQLVDKVATAWNAAFAEILCSTWDYADAAASRCVTRIRWEILRLALNEHEHDGRGGSLFDLASVVPQVNAAATSTGGARFSSSCSDADALQNSRAQWAESLLARAAKTMSHLDLMKMPDENVDEAAGTQEPLFAGGVEEDQEGRDLSSSPSARPEQEQNQKREGGPRPPRTLSPIEHALRVLRLTECPQTLASLMGAYRSRCLQCHPDKGGSNEAFHELHAAFVTLRDVVVPLVPSSSPRPPRTAAAQDETKHAHSEEAHPEDGDAAAQNAASKASRSRPPSEEPTTLLVSRLADLASFLESICVAVSRGAAENVSHAVSLGRVMLEAVGDFVTLLRVVSERLLEQSTDVLGEHDIGTTSTTTCYATVAREIAFEAAASHRAADIVSEMARSAGETLVEAEKFVEHVRQADQPHQEEEVADLRVEIGHLLAQSASRLRSCVAHAEGRCQAAASLVLKIDEAREARAARTHTTEGHEEGARTVAGGGGAGDLLLAYVRRFSRQQWQQAERDELRHLIRATGVHDEELFRVLAESTASCRKSCGNTSKEALADLVQEFPNILVDLRHRRALVDHLLGLDKTRTLEILAG